MPEMEEGFLYRSYLCSYVFMRSVSSTAIVRDTAEYHHAGMSFLPVILPMFAAFYIVTQTSRIGEYISAFTQMHLPNEVIIPLAVMLRFVPTIQEEWQMVNQALRLRGMALTWKNVLRRPLQMMEYMLVPFLLQCSVIVDEMSAAVMARGFDKNMPRTSYAEVQMKALDWCIIAVSAGLLFWNLCF